MAEQGLPSERPRALRRQVLPGFEPGQEFKRLPPKKLKPDNNLRQNSSPERRTFLPRATHLPPPDDAWPSPGRRGTLPRMTHPPPPNDASGDGWPGPPARPGSAPPALLGRGLEGVVVGGGRVVAAGGGGVAAAGAAVAGVVQDHRGDDRTEQVVDDLRAVLAQVDGVEP